MPDVVTQDTEAKRVVLVVDDDEPMLKSLSRALQGVPARLQLMGSGEEAIAWLQEGNQPDCVITDLHMGAVTGLDVLQAVRRLAPQAWCALHTAEPHPGLDPDVKVLVKPIDVEAMRKLVVDALARWN